ncbi:hypothetical protein ACFXTI_014625 [Malus domestica]
MAVVEWRPKQWTGLQPWSFHWDSILLFDYFYVCSHTVPVTKGKKKERQLLNYLPCRSHFTCVRKNREAISTPEGINRSKKGVAMDFYGASSRNKKVQSSNEFIRGPRKFKARSTISRFV